MTRHHFPSLPKLAFTVHPLFNRPKITSAEIPVSFAHSSKVFWTRSQTIIMLPFFAIVEDPLRRDKGMIEYHRHKMVKEAIGPKMEGGHGLLPFGRFT
jgi:hypothetical protein